VAIVRQLDRHRFLSSTHIAALVSRSLDRTNDRLGKLFHAGYLDRPHAQWTGFPPPVQRTSRTHSPTEAPAS
jgi:hypothetical protein